MFYPRRKTRQAACDSDLVFPKLLNALHDGLQNWLTRDKCALEKILGHEGRGKASKRETSHRRSHTPFLRAQMYCSAGYRQRTERPRRSK